MTSPSPGEETLSPQQLVERHLALFNDSVLDGDFARLLEDFTDDATMRFENVPGAGVLEYQGLGAIKAAYDTRPPDDQLDVIDTPVQEEGDVVVRFAWRREGSTGTLRLSRRGDRIAALTVSFD